MLIIHWIANLDVYSLLNNFSEGQSVPQVWGTGSEEECGFDTFLKHSHVVISAGITGLVIGTGVG